MDGSFPNLLKGSRCVRNALLSPLQDCDRWRLLSSRSASKLIHQVAEALTVHLEKQSDFYKGQGRVIPLILQNEKLFRLAWMENLQEKNLANE